MPVKRNLISSSIQERQHSGLKAPIVPHSSDRWRSICLCIRDDVLNTDTRVRTEQMMIAADKECLYSSFNKGWRKVCAMESKLIINVSHENHEKSKNFKKQLVQNGFFGKLVITANAIFPDCTPLTVFSTDINTIQKGGEIKLFD